MKKKSSGDVVGLMATLEKVYGENAIYIPGSKKVVKNVEVIPTGSLALDHAVGVGGIPCGRITEIFGPESGGKTTLTLHIVANAQRLGKRCAFLDVEHALDFNYAKSIGVNMDDLLFSQPDSAEQTLDMAEKMISSGIVQLVVIDSVAGMIPMKEIEGDFGDANMGLAARLMGQGARKLSGAAARSNATMIFINQIREKMGFVGWGNNEITPGGRALKFFSSLRLDIRSKGKLKDGGGAATGNRVLVKVAKNKLAPPFCTAEFNLVFGEGIDRYGELIEFGLAAGLIKRNGSKYSLGSKEFGSSYEKARLFLKEKPALVEKLFERLQSGKENG